MQECLHKIIADKESLRRGIEEVTKEFPEPKCHVCSGYNYDSFPEAQRLSEWDDTRLQEVTRFQELDPEIQGVAQALLEEPVEMNSAKLAESIYKYPSTERMLQLTSNGTKELTEQQICQIIWERFVLSLYGRLNLARKVVAVNKKAAEVFADSHTYWFELHGGYSALHNLSSQQMIRNIQHDKEVFHTIYWPIQLPRL